MAILLIILMLILVISAHEAGHYFVAKRHGVIATAFSIGFGPALLNIWRDKQTGRTRLNCPIINKSDIDAAGTVIKIKLLFLFGGSCEFNDREMEEKLTPWQKVKVYIAGPAVNYFLGLAFWVISQAGHSNVIDAAWSYIKLSVTIVPMIIKALGQAILPASNTLASSTNELASLISTPDNFTVQMLLAAGIFALLNLLLAIVNLIPIPVLDGGQVVFGAIEAVGKKIPQKVTTAINKASFVLVMAYMALWLIKDLVVDLFFR